MLNHYLGLMLINPCIRSHKEIFTLKEDCGVFSKSPPSLPTKKREKILTVFKIHTFMAALTVRVQ